jgi:alkyl hydroperoxide reductase subunit AhpF
MGARDFEGQVLSGADGAARHQVDVLVIGGGPAGAWAAIR